MRVAVFGATGSMGSLVVKSLVERGHEAVAVSRSKPDLEMSGRHESRVGDLTDPAFAARAIEGCDAVISCIGQKRKAASLWSACVSPPDILSTVAKAIIVAIGTDASKRFVYLSAFGVGEDLKKHSIIFRLILRSSSIWTAYQDHAEAERIIKASPVRWTIVKPPGLTDADRDVNLVDRGDRWSSFETVTRKSLARFLVECAEDEATIGRSMTIGEKKP
jgi:uncharacterized protein YbjT (DUF2867 family)